MLIQFTVANFYSFNEPVTLNMTADDYDLEDANRLIINLPHDLTLTKSAVIYGANNSGKSNLLKAMQFMAGFVLYSLTNLEYSNGRLIPFLLTPDNSEKPSFFEIIIQLEDCRYRYGFELKPTAIISEWLFSLQNNAEEEIGLFYREEQNFNSSPDFFEEGVTVTKASNSNIILTRTNALFLSVITSFGGKISEKIVDWFRMNIVFISGLSSSTRNYTFSRIEKDKNFKENLLIFLNKMGIKIKDFIIELDATNNKYIIKNVVYETIKDKTLVNIKYQFESVGTQKLIALLGPIFDILDKGKTVVIDELDSSFHTLLTKKIVKLFHSPERKAQIIFTTHDTNLLKKELFRRDQIWFTEKKDDGSTDLYSLLEYKPLNSLTTYEEDYLTGRYGAIPFASEIERFKYEYLGLAYEQK